MFKGAVFLRFFMMLVFLFTSSSAVAQITVDVSEDDKLTTIHARHETLTSFLNFMHNQYGTTSTLPVATVTDKINSDSSGKSLLAATQKLLHAYNTGLVLGEGNSISHISILSAGSQTDNNHATIEIGSVDARDKQQYQQMLRRINLGFNRFGHGHSRVSALTQGLHGSWHHRGFSRYDRSRKKQGRQLQGYVADKARNRHYMFNHSGTNMY